MAASKIGRQPPTQHADPRHQVQQAIIISVVIRMSPDVLRYPPKPHSVWAARTPKRSSKKLALGGYRNSFSPFLRRNQRLFINTTNRQGHSEQ